MLLDPRHEKRTNRELARNAKKRKGDPGGTERSTYIGLEHGLRGYPADYTAPEQLSMLRLMLGV